MEAFACGCGCLTLTAFNLFMGWVTQQVWVILRPEQPIDYAPALCLWIFIGLILLILGKSK